MMRDRTITTTPEPHTRDAKGRIRPRTYSVCYTVCYSFCLTGLGLRAAERECTGHGNAYGHRMLLNQETAR